MQTRISESMSIQEVYHGSRLLTETRPLKNENKMCSLLEVKIKCNVLYVSTIFFVSAFFLSSVSVMRMILVQFTAGGADVGLEMTVGCRNIGISSGFTDLLVSLFRMSSSSPFFTILVRTGKGFTGVFKGVTVVFNLAGFADFGLFLSLGLLELDLTNSAWRDSSFFLSISTRILSLSDFSGG